MREFSEESRQHFDDLIDEVNDSDWCAFTDFLGDLQYNYGGVIHMPYSLAEKAGVADDYWTDVIDANNTEKSEIDEIFETVKGIDKDYESKFTQYIETVTAQIDIIKSLDEIVKPLQGNFTTDKIGEVIQKTNVDIEELERMYGFTEEEAKLLNKAIEKLTENSGKDVNDPEAINYVYGTLTSLCVSYDSTRWHMTCGTKSVDDSIKELENAGLSDQEILDLRVIINLQHGNFSHDKLKTYGIDVTKSSFSDETHEKMVERSVDPNNDWAHQTVQIAAFANGDSGFSMGRYAIDLINSSDGNYSYTDYEISFKGDIDSGRYDEADFQSDVDAINIYNRMINSYGKSMNTIWSEYYIEIEEGDTKRSVEFFKNLGGGYEDIGMLELDKILQKETIGSKYISQGNGMSEADIDEANSKFVQWLFSDYYGYEYDF